MDCNSYSYAPTLGSEHPDPISEYSNDDMTATLDYWKNQYNAHPQHPRINDYIVQASSYDGQLEIEEVFHKMESAFFLYTHIVTHYKSTPPDYRKLNPLIKRMHKSDNA